MRKTTLFAMCLVLVIPGWVAAETIPLAITGVTGTAFQQGDSPDPGDGSISRVLDGTGLTVGDPGDSSTWTHDATWQNNWQGNGTFTGGNTPGAWFVADLGSVHTDLAELHIWNVREATALDRGMKDVEIYYATTPFPPSAWTSLGNFTIPQAPGGATAADMVIDLSGVSSAQYVGFDIKTNYGSTFRVGVAEMQFTVPEPATWVALLSAAAMGLVASVLRRRKS